VATTGALSVAAACAQVGGALAAVPWIERWPVTLRAAPTLVDRRWVLSDPTGSVGVAPDAVGVSHLVALSGGRPVDVTAEWTAAGLRPLAVHQPHRSVSLYGASPVGAPTGRVR
jgi:hypothetical protein